MARRPRQRRCRRDQRDKGGVGRGRRAPGAFRKYLEHRTSLSRPRAPIISETATFTFVGAGATGKTVLGAVAASVTGHHESRSIWDFSRRGLEEYLESRNQIGAIFDDTEKHIGEHLPIETAIAIVTQYVAGGRSKEISATAKRLGSIGSRGTLLR